ncbi:MAG: hypothetical protein JWM03_697, partial [Rhodocyclales bacterium]|nr:hypothetical protein [Rhodocyclales bacterium]
MVLAEHRVEHASARGEKFVIGLGGRIPLARGLFEYSGEAIRNSLIRAEDTEIALCVVELCDIAQKGPGYARVAIAEHTGFGYLLCIFAKVRHAQVAQQHAAVGMGIRTHAASARWGKLRQFRLQFSGCIEQLFGSIA